MPAGQALRTATLLLCLLTAGAAGAQERALVLDTTPIFKAAHGKPTAHSLKGGTTIVLLSRPGDLFRTARETKPSETGSSWFRTISDDRTDGWIFGDHLAIDDRGTTTCVADLDGDGSSEHVWTAVKDGAQAYLVAASADESVLAWTPLLAPLRLRCADVADDGRMDVLVQSAQSVEILRLTKGKLRPVFSTDLPPNTQPFRLEIAHGRIWRRSIPPIVDTAALCWGRAFESDKTLCLVQHEQVWNWNVETQHFVIQKDDPAMAIRARTRRALDLQPQPVDGFDHGAHLDSGTPVHVQQVSGLGTAVRKADAEGYRVLVVARDGSSGWMRSSDLAMQDNYLRVHLQGDAETIEAQPRIVW